MTTEQPQTLQLPAPQAPRAELLEDGCSAISADSPAGPVLIVYDAQRLAGGVYHIEQRLWRIQHPVLRAEFLAGLETAGYSITDQRAFGRWMAATAPALPAAAN